MNEIAGFLCFGLFVVAACAAVAAGLRLLQAEAKIERLAEERAAMEARVAALEWRLTESARAVLEAKPEPVAPATPPSVPAAEWADSPVAATAAEPTPLRPSLPPPLPPLPPLPLPPAEPAVHSRFAEAENPARATSTTVSPSATPEPAHPFSLERFLGGRVLLAIGVISVLIGAGFFLKLAIDRGWIGPPARIVLGIVVGAAALAGGEVLIRRGFRHYGASVMGGGIGLFYLCDYFASVRYEMWDRPVAFAIAGGITAAACVLAHLRNASALAWLGFGGALAAPAFLGSNEDALAALTIWLALVSCGMGALLMRRDWRGFEVLASVVHAAYFIGWKLRYASPERDATAAVCLFVLAALPAVVSIAAAAWRRGAVPVTAHVALAIGAIAGVTAGRATFYPHHRPEFGAGILAGAALVGGLAALVRSRCGRDSRDVGPLLAAALALAATGGLFLLRGNAVAPVFAFAGAALVLSSAGRSRVAVAGGWGFVGIAAIDVLVSHLPLRGGAPMFANAQFLVALTPCVAALAAAWPRAAPEDAARAWSEPGAIARAGAIGCIASLVSHDAARAASFELVGNAARAAEVSAAAFAAAACAIVTAAFMKLRGRFTRVQTLPVGPFALAAILGAVAAGADVSRDYQEFPGPLFLASVACAAALFGAAFLGVMRDITGGVAACIFFLAISARIHAWGVHDGDWLRGQMWMSGAWALYATTLLVTGFWRQIRPARWAGIGLFLATAAKVLLIDLSRLDTPARVGSFLVLGVLLVGASFLYQRLTREPPTT